MKEDLQYDVIIIGSGAAGQVAAVHSRGLGKKVLLINNSNKPTASKFIHDIQLKSLVKYAEDVERSRVIAPFGVKVPDKIDSEALMDAVRTKMEKVSKFSSFEELEKAGIETKKGKAAFVNKNTVKAGNSEYSAKIVIIAAGAVPVLPEIKGIEGDAVLTPSQFFLLNTLPKSICIIGAGPAGCQFASALAVFGCKVILVEKSDRILAREDDECAGMAQKMLESRGILLITEAGVSEIENNQGKSVVHFSTNGKKRRVSVEKVLICAGMRPSVDGLNLDSAGIEYSENGIQVNERMQTSNQSIYACGDVTGPYYMTNRAEVQGAVAAVNALGGKKQKASYGSRLWSLSLLPDLSRFGMRESEAAARYGKYMIRVYKFPYKYSMNSVVRDSTEGYAKIICKRNGKILGAHIIGESSAELVSRLYQAQQNGANFAKLSFLNQIFPSYSDIISKPSLRAYIEQHSANIVGGILTAFLPHKRG